MALYLQRLLYIICTDSIYTCSTYRACDHKITTTPQLTYSRVDGCGCGNGCDRRCGLRSRGWREVCIHVIRKIMYYDQTVLFTTYMYCTHMHKYYCMDAFSSLLTAYYIHPCTCIKCTQTNQLTLCSCSKEQKNITHSLICSRTNTPMLCLT